MASRKISVIYYGAGNLHSVMRGIRACGLEPCLVEKPADLQVGTRMVLPGVGAFHRGMENLHQSGLSDAVLNQVAKEVPLLGVCLGAQLIMDWSVEFKRSDGLGLISGGVVPIEPGNGLKVPHVGWAPIRATRAWAGTVLERSSEGEFIYFNHSFVCALNNPSDCLATAQYGTATFPAVVTNGIVTGVQGHPELSDINGIEILRRFAEM